jgi:hypothetical protein
MERQGLSKILERGPISRPISKSVEKEVQKIFFST